jgi:hypothetical protein
MNSDYAFMKTGILDAPDNPAFSDFVTRILGVITVMLQKAVETAGVFADHGVYHREINADDIRRAMKVQAQTFFKSEDLEDRVASVVEDIQDQQDQHHEEVLKKIKLRKIRGRRRKVAAGRADVVEDIAVDDDFVDIPEVPEVIELPYNTCECQTCREIRDLVDAWETWDPEDEVEKFLKKHIDAM